MEERKSFMFYLSWKDQVDEMDDKELRTFITNLIKWHKDESVELPTKIDKLIWSGILPSLEVNDKKWKQRAKSSINNGKLGGRPPKQQNPVGLSDNLENPVGLSDNLENPVGNLGYLEKPRKPVKSKELIVDSKKLIDDSRELIEDSRELIEDSRELIEDELFLNNPLTLDEFHKEQWLKNIPLLNIDSKIKEILLQLIEGQITLKEKDVLKDYKHNLKKFHIIYETVEKYGI